MKFGAVSNLTAVSVSPRPTCHRLFQPWYAMVPSVTDMSTDVAATVAKPVTAFATASSRLENERDLNVSLKSLNLIFFCMLRFQSTPA